MRRPLFVAAALLPLAMAPVLAAPAAAEPVEVTFVRTLPGPLASYYVDGSVVASPVAFGDVTRAPAETGERVIGVGPAAGVSPLLTETVVVGPGTSVVFQPTATGAGALVAYSDDLSPVAPGAARVTVRHTAAAGPVDVVLSDGSGLTPVADDLANGDEAGPVEIPAGTYAVVTSSVADDSVIGGLSRSAVTFEAGRAYVVYAAGIDPGDPGVPLDPGPGLEPPVDTGVVLDPEPEVRADDLTVVIDMRDVGTAPSDPPAEPGAGPTSDVPTPSEAATSTAPRIPTAVPAGEGSAGRTGPAAWPAMVVLATAALMAAGLVAVGRRPRPGTHR